MTEFGHKIPVRDEAGEIVGMRPSVVSRVTRHGLNGEHGKDRGRKLAVSLLDGDIVSVRPVGTRREPLTVTAQDLYTVLLRWQANRITLEKARERKARKQEQAARLRQERAEKKLFSK